MHRINQWLIILTVLPLLLTITSCDQPNTREKRILVFTKTEGYRHESIEPGVAAVRKLGEENGFTVLHTEDATQFNEELLKTLSAVVFLNTTQDVLNPEQEAQLERFIQAGGGFVGIHAAADTEYDWKWYGDLLGGYFHSHPQQQDADIKVVDKEHISTGMLPETWSRYDEWYNYKEIRDGLNVLMKLDESTYEGGNMGADHPIAWYHEFDGGRAWYTGLGHTAESFSEELFLEHLLGGILYAIGDNKVDYSLAHTYPLPDQSRFVKTVLASNLDEPMELDMLPDGRILFIERKGMIKLYDPERDYLSIVTKLPVFTEEEDGLLGIAVDPRYEENNWIYLYYSDPDPDNWEQHLSRFVFKDGRLDRASEKILLRVPVQRETCCHSGGSVEFGPDGLLYVSAGDDTNPFASDGYAPIDERPGRSSWDAQRSSANTNDLRGKILRIRPEADGTYSIPEGNLFPPGTPNTRPEIYAMGLRNPFRISIDQRRNWLFWGDVGPDAGKDSLTRGPKGLDEINLAMTPGNWGWPHTRGNNQAYHDYDFATNTSGPKFDPANPVNDSPNNTGLRELPPARSSLIWYSYDESEEFPWVGTGGKNPMAGPVYYMDDYPAATRYPAYFDGKLFIYEWMRHWFFTVKLDEEGHFRKADPFMPDAEFSRPMDVIVGNDGRLYLLEYGNLWFSRNLDARLSRIDYIRGNRPPKAVITAERWVGGDPFEVSLSAAESVDPDGDKLRYEWWIGPDKQEESSATLNHIFNYPGVYTVKLKVEDQDKEWSITQAQVQVGNEPPKIAWQINGNQTFYWDRQSIPYRLEVTDREDGSTAGGSIDPARVTVSFDYLPQGTDMTVIAQGHQAGIVASRLARGAKLIEESDCQNCHAKDKKVNGPSYEEIAARYRNNPNAETTLATKVINGGAGVWGETVMSAHPQLTEEQAREMVRYILTISDEPAVQEQSHDLQGVFVAEEHLSEENREGVYLLMATYTDLGSGKIDPITVREEVILRHPRLQAENYDEKSPDLSVERSGRMGFLSSIRNGDYFAFNDIDLTGVTSVTIQLGSMQPLEGGCIQLRRGGSPDGEVLGSADIPAGARGLTPVTMPVTPQTGKHKLFFLFLNGPNGEPVDCAVDWVFFGQEEETLISQR
jgi:cytochrome c